MRTKAFEALEDFVKSHNVPVTWPHVLALIKGLSQSQGPIVIALQARCAELESLAQLMDARVKALEAKPAMEYRGTWTAEQTYSPGDCVTDHGSIWHCHRQATSAAQRPGTSPPHWQLACKKGADGKDLRATR
jgi:hypothetical protein